MLRALFKQGSFWTITNEKTFRDLGSGFVVVQLNFFRQEINQQVSALD